MTTRASYLALAERAERAEGADRELDIRIGWTLDGEGYSEADVQYVQHNKHAAAVTPFTASLDAALREIDALGGPFIAQMGDIAANGLPGVCLCVSTDPVKHVWGIGHGHDYIGRLARAAIAAALRARAEEAKDGE